jgi:predicted glycogen debranching enzyme
MDAKVGDWVVTPRHGKPVEVNALYHNALRVMEAFGTRFGDPDAARYRREADRVAISFRRAFWDAEHERLYDVIRADGPDPRMRPNQIFAVSLPNSMLSPSQMRAVVRSVEKELLTPYGLRTLSPNDPEYRPAYGGDPLRRDGAYHQGTVWPWLLGPFVTAYLRAFGRTAKNVAYATALVEGLARHTTSACLGTVSEVVDADVPHAPGGAPAQAWSVAELLRILCGELARGM